MDDRIKKSRESNIIATFDFLNMLGWKYHESQQKAKQRGSAQFSLKDVVQDINEQEGEEKVKYGVIIDDGDEIIEKKS